MPLTALAAELPGSLHNVASSKRQLRLLINVPHCNYSPPFSLTQDGHTEKNDSQRYT